MIKMKVICSQKPLHRFYIKLLVILLAFFSFVYLILSFNTFNEPSQTNVLQENTYLSDDIPLNKAQKGQEKSKNTILSSSSAPFQQVLSIQEIRRRIDEYNKLQTVLNEGTFGPLQKGSLVIVIQVHNRLVYLRHTIFSLSQAKGINNALLVFSHDYYDEEINNAIQSIDFCKVIQIFYPYSIQTHPNEFPGQSKDDCPPNINMKEAKERNCTNALHPDQYGHYRVAKITQTKHHWWWKANRVFDGLNITKNFAGLVVFFEEDHYVGQDFIHMLHLMEHTRQSACPSCNVLSLGKHVESVNFATDSKKAEIMKWSVGMHNMGMTFNRSAWQELKSCAKTFCTYDDYNWDWTLLAVSNKCLSKEVTTMVLCAPRVFHIGECGMHFNNNCNNTQMLRRAQKLLETSSAYFYPQDLYLTRIDGYGYLKNPVANGGWGDVRDHDLCIKMVDR